MKKIELLEQEIESLRLILKQKDEAFDDMFEAFETMKKLYDDLVNEIFKLQSNKTLLGTKKQ